MYHKDENDFPPRAQPITYQASLIKQSGTTYYLNDLPTTEAGRRALGNEMIQWVTTFEIYALEEFPIGKSMSPKEFFDLANEDDYFARCLDFAKRVIGVRLVYGLKDKTLPKDFVMKMLMLYHPEFKEIMNEGRRIAAEVKNESIAKHVFNVHMDSIPAIKDNFALKDRVITSE